MNRGDEILMDFLEFITTIGRGMFLLQRQLSKSANVCELIEPAALGCDASVRPVIGHIRSTHTCRAFVPTAESSFE